MPGTNLFGGQCQGVLGHLRGESGASDIWTSKPTVGRWADDLDVSGEERRGTHPSIVRNYGTVVTLIRLFCFGGVGMSIDESSVTGGGAPNLLVPPATKYMLGLAKPRLFCTSLSWRLVSPPNKPGEPAEAAGCLPGQSWTHWA